VFKGRFYRLITSLEDEPLTYKLIASKHTRNYFGDHFEHYEVHNTYREYQDDITRSIDSFNLAGFYNKEWMYKRIPTY